MWMGINYTLILEILFILIVLQVIFVILLENRNPYKTTAWILILTSLPILGLLLYLFFGEEQRKKHSIQKKLYKGLEDKHPDMFVFENGIQPYPEYAKLATMLLNIADAPILCGNTIQFFSDGKDKFEQFFEDIRNAKHHVHILYYKILDDKIGLELQELLISKAAQGVEVRVIYDDVGSLKAKTDFFKQMTDRGVEVEPFLEVRIPRIARSINYRNHRKLAIIDGTIGYIGGMNIADCYIEGVSWGYWRDMQIRIEGNGVKGLQKVFLQDWYFIRKSLPQSPKYFPSMEVNGNNPLQVVSSGPIDAYNCIERGMFQAINEATKSIYIQTPYFVPSEKILAALQTASVSGVDVHVMLPRKSDNLFLDGANNSFVRDLLRYNIRVYLYTAGFLHTKSLVIDEKVTIMGSANMDIRSFELSFETSVFIYDIDTARKAIGIFEKDAIDSELVVKETWKKRSFRKRAFESIMRLFTPVL